MPAGRAASRTVSISTILRYRGLMSSSCDRCAWSAVLSQALTEHLSAAGPEAQLRADNTNRMLVIFIRPTNAAHLHRLAHRRGPPAPPPGQPQGILSSAAADPRGRADPPRNVFVLP